MPEFSLNQKESYTREKSRMMKKRVFSLRKSKRERKKEEERKRGRGIVKKDSGSMKCVI